jgi:hypothetical protein
MRTWNTQLSSTGTRGPGAVVQPSWESSSNAIQRIWPAAKAKFLQAFPYQSPITPSGPILFQITTVQFSPLPGPSKCTTYLYQFACAAWTSMMLLPYGLPTLPKYCTPLPLELVVLPNPRIEYISLELTRALSAPLARQWYCCVDHWLENTFPDCK